VAPQVPAACHDNGDGSYTITQTLAKRGKYEVSVNLDGEPIAGSPFTTVAIHPRPPKAFKWLAPRVSGNAPEKFAHAVCVTSEQNLLIFGGVDGGVYSNELRLLSTRSQIKCASATYPVPPTHESGIYRLYRSRPTCYDLDSAHVPTLTSYPLPTTYSLLTTHYSLLTTHYSILNTQYSILTRFDTPKMAGKPPSPRAGCAAALSGHRLFLYGGESDATGPPLDDLCCLDLEGASWQQLIGRGMSPGRLSFAAAASIGNKVYLFGGCTGEGVTNSFHSLDVVSTMWDPIESLTSQPPSPRMGHSMVAVCSQLLVYGGKDKATGKVFAGLAVFDTQGEHWSTLQARARTP
jgi:hypothetical protein